MTAARLWSGFAMNLAAAAGVVAWLRPQPGAGTPWLMVGGAICGVALFALVAGRAPVRLARLPAAPVIVIVAAALAEETVWRVGCLLLLRHALPAAAALALGTAAFALAHGGTQGRRGVATHTITGAGFGLLFLSSGSLAAAAAAHGVYNLLAASTAVRRARPAPLPASAVPPAQLLRVVKRYGRAVALEDVSFQLEAGEVLGLLGPNGAGKSTACSLLLGLRRPDAGRAELFGLDPRKPAARRRVGAAPQESGFPPTLRLGEIVALALRHFDRPESQPALLERFGLSLLERRQAGGISGGQRRLLAVALAFGGRPDVVLLDEPTAGLDLDSRRLVRDQVRRSAETGASVLLTTHDLAEAEALADRVIVLDRGRVAAEGTLPQIRALVGLATIVLPAQRLPPVPGLVASERTNGSVVLTVRDAGDAVRALACAGADLGDLAVRPASLEEAVAVAVGST